MDGNELTKPDEARPPRKRAESIDMPGADYPPPRRRGEVDASESTEALLRRSIGNTVPPQLRWLVRKTIADGMDLGQFRTLLKRHGTPQFALWMLETYWRFIWELPEDDKRREPGKEPT